MNESSSGSDSLDMSLGDGVVGMTPSTETESKKPGRLERILKQSGKFVDGTRKHAVNGWHGLPVEWQMGISNTAKPAAYVGNGLKRYYDNLASSRFLMYQFIGAIGTLGTKLALPALGILDDGSYSDHLKLQFLATAGQVAAQMSAYVTLETRKYGQSMLHAAREYAAWRSLEITLSLPGYFVNAGQAAGAGHFVGAELGAASTSLPFSTGQLFKAWHIPVFHGIYKRLQLRKESGRETDWNEVFAILHHGVSNAAHLLAEKGQKYAARPAVAALNATADARRSAGYIAATLFTMTTPRS